MAMSTTTPDAGGGAQAPISEGGDGEISLLETLRVLCLSFTMAVLRSGT